MKFLKKLEKNVQKTERIQVLRDNNSWALKDILRGSLDKTVEWNLPAGEEVPYEANEAHTAPGNLMRENQKFKYFVKGGPGDKMLKAKREKYSLGY